MALPVISNLIMGERKKQCKHNNTTKVEAVKHTVIETHHPISNSRFQQINDFEIAKVNEIKVPALKCLDCGEIIEIKKPMVGSCATGHYSTAQGYVSCATGNNNIGIGGYAGDYTERSLTDKIIDMGFLNDMEEALGNAEKRRAKAMKNFANQQAKLDNIADGENTLTSEIDRIKSEYDNIVNRQHYKQQQAQQQFQGSNVFTDSIREAASVVRKVGESVIPQPPPPPNPRNMIGYGTNSGFYYEPPSKPLNEFSNIEFLKFMFSGISLEEKTFKDVNYFDIIFPNPVDQDDSKLNVLEKGDVIEWVKVPKNKNMGMLSPKVKAIKAIRISLEDLEEARKPQTNES